MTDEICVRGPLVRRSFDKARYQQHDEVDVKVDILSCVRSHP